MSGFTKKLRFSTAGDFRRLFHAGKKLNTEYFAIYIYPNQLVHPRLGLVITKKVARLAIKRNQIKRVVRESFRLNQMSFNGLDIMIVAYRDIDKLTKAELREQLERGWKKLSNWHLKS